MKNSPNKSFVFHRRLNYQYPVIARGKGIYLFDKQGKKYIDATGGALVANLGHGLKEIANEIGKLAQRFSYLHGSQFTTQEMEDYAKELCAFVPQELRKVFFVSGGSEAAESAIKLARQYHYDSGNKGKYLVISRKPAYHGSTILPLSLASRKSHRQPYLPLLFKFPVISAPFCYHCPFKKSYPQCNLQCAWQLEKTIKKAGPEKVSAFIAEPVIGASAGAVVPPKEYFSVIRQICDKYNVVLILDEVMTGFGRTGKWFAFLHWNILPDIVFTSKGIAAGIVPFAAVFCRDKIVQTIKKGSGNFVHGLTFENNPLTTGTARAVLKYVKERNLVARGREMGKYLFLRLSTLADLSIVGDIRGLGLMTAVEFVENKKTKKPFSRKIQVAEKIVQAALKRGLNLYFAIGFIDSAHGADSGDAVMVAPPFIVTKKEIDEIIDIFKESILEVQNNINKN
ncbi:MAG: aminotransferase class III-fold pyridoxal phosphate-dependent enzyme [Candidatus Pacebacteria bacterium]|nr:aminotransferase class III-fold pyridoxal phosphate-dependent enzyme [Candidatus Paceibacterota bacterium]